MTAITISDQEYRDFSRFLESQCGIVLGDSKQYLVRSRLSPLVTKFKLGSLSDLLRDVVTGRNRELRVAAVDAMTTNETLWFRDTYPFEVLANKLLPEVAANKRPIKIWSAASFFWSRAVFNGDDYFGDPTAQTWHVAEHVDNGNRHLCQYVGHVSSGDLRQPCTRSRPFTRAPSQLL